MGREMGFTGPEAIFTAAPPEGSTEPVLIRLTPVGGSTGPLLATLTPPPPLDGSTAPLLFPVLIPLTPGGSTASPEEEGPGVAAEEAIASNSADPPGGGNWKDGPTPAFPEVAADADGTVGFSVVEEGCWER